jgi:hypothetical protein
MLFRMTGCAKRNGVAIAWFDACPTIGSGTHMRGLGWRRFAARDTGEPPDKSQVLSPPMRSGLGLRFATVRGIRGGGIARGIPSGSMFARSVRRIAKIASRISPVAKIRLLRHWTIPTLACNAAFSANLPCGTGTSYLARIFSITRSIK